MNGRTYRYFEGKPLYPFGYGLSYTKFGYSNLTLPDNIKAGDNVIVSVEVQNTGKTAGDEVVQLYVKDVESSVMVPVHSLQGFKRIHLEQGEKRVVEFKLNRKQLSVIKVNKNNEVNYVIEPGFFEISVGGTQPGTSSPTTEVVTKKLEVTGISYTITR